MDGPRHRQLTTNIPAKPQSIMAPKYIKTPSQPQHLHIAPQQPQQPLDRIHMQLSHIDKITRELHNVAEKIKSLGIMNPHNTNIPIIDQIQNDFHHSLNELIQNIRQFYLDIDAKLKNLGFFVNTQFTKKNSQSLTGEQINTLIEESTDAKYQMLQQRIKGLEVSLRETQNNESKLIKVIENMMERYQINDQPTLIRDTPTLQNQFKRNRMATTTTSSSTNLKYPEDRSVDKRKSPLPNNNLFKPETKTKSIYENLYTIDESIVNEEGTLTANTAKPQHFRLRQIEEEDDSNQVYIKKLYSKYPIPNFQTESKKSLKGELGNSTHESAVKPERSMTSSLQDDKQHRFNFLLGKLNL